MTYDYLQQHYPSRSNKEYLGILELSAKESETAVDEALNYLINGSHPLTLAKVEAIVDSGGVLESAKNVDVSEVDLSQYDSLLTIVMEVT